MDPEVARFVLGGMATALVSVVGAAFKFLLDSNRELKAELTKRQGKDDEMVVSQQKTIDTLHLVLIQYQQERTANQQGSPGANRTL